MRKSGSTPSFATLLQNFFVEHLTHHRAVSPRTVAAYRDCFRLLLQFAEQHIGKSPTTFALTDLNAGFTLAFLDHLEQDRHNGVRTRNVRLAALRSFLKYAAHHDLSALQVIEKALAVPMKRFDRPMLGFLSRPEMQAILDAPLPPHGLGSGIGRYLQCSTTPAHASRRSLACASRMLSLMRHLLSTSWARAVRSEACRCGDQQSA